MRDLMLRFASLGDNCEFGFAQRACQAEPMDLLRWASTPAGVVLRLLREDFKGIGDNLTVKELGRAHVVINEHYGFNWHDWTRPEKADVDAIAARESRRLPAMAAKWRKEMREASRIFVVKQSLKTMSAELAARVQDAMAAYGEPVLLFVTQGAPVSVTEVKPRLLHGTIPEFANPGRVPSTTRSEEWLKLCEAAAALVDERYAVRDQEHTAMAGGPQTPVGATP
jgi:hypothetical protein